MLWFLFQRLVLPALAANLVLTSAAPRTGSVTLRLATGGHGHLSFERSRHREGGSSHAAVHQHEDAHEHSDATDVHTDVHTGEPHRHACLHLALHGGDWRPLKLEADPLMRLDAVPWPPPAVADPTGLATCGPLVASPSAPPVPPPHLLRSTVLLI
jgi:hypothetical protein